MYYNEDLEHINDIYFEWLYGIVEDSDREYEFMLRQLFCIEFSDDTAILIDTDANRIDDAMELRKDFIREHLSREDSYLIESFNRQTCSLLEMMISLAYRMEDIMGLDRFPDWFWIMVGNLGLDEFTDDILQGRSGRKMIDKIERKISNLLNREYCRDGTGGLFPLKDPDSDQRKVEIWYQMHAYLIEFYF